MDRDTYGTANDPVLGEQETACIDTKMGGSDCLRPAGPAAGAGNDWSDPRFEWRAARNELALSS